MGNVIVSSITRTPVAQGGGVWGGLGAGESYIYETDFEAGVLGQGITDFVTTFNTTYSNDITGPDGSAQVAKMSPPFQAKYFGGNMLNVDYGAGSDIWVSWYQYFPTGFIFANGINGDGNGGAGALKWLRLQYVGNSERVTLGIDATGGWTSGPALEEMQYDWIAGEAMNWVERHGNVNYFYDDPTTPKIPLQQWHQVQMHIHLSAGDTVVGDGDGFIRTWVDDAYLGQVDRNTMPINGNKLTSIWMGDYWNGGAPQTQSWYADRVRIADQPPTTTDSGGRPYIAPVGA
tara:strand:- start:1110 stop:1976 length:867 start_codon:yes stop_codon:yes gene_type:complete